MKNENLPVATSTAEDMSDKAMARMMAFSDACEELEAAQLELDRLVNQVEWYSGKCISKDKVFALVQQIVDSEKRKEDARRQLAEDDQKQQTLLSKDKPLTPAATPAEEHVVLRSLLQATVAVLKRHSTKEDPTAHRSAVLQEMITQGQFPVECGLTFSEIIALAEKKGLLRVDGEKVDLLW